MPTSVTTLAPVPPDGTPSSLATPPPIPGLEVVGRGIYLRPYQPYSLVQILFPREQYRVITSQETRTSYSLPAGYEVNESPPLPVNTALNQVCIEESWDRFEKQRGLDANAAVSKMPFSISATTSWNNQLRLEQEAYYATRSSFVPLWSVYLPDTNTCIDEISDPDIPVPFSRTHRRAYDEFFRRYGTHFVSRAWVGGKSTLVFTVLKSTQLAKEDIHAGIKASFLKYGGGVGTKDEASRERLKRSSQCTVFGKGGDEVLLAAMSSLDEEAYNGWLKTIPNNPAVIELDVAGIWTLVRDPAKADALMEAYRESVSFIPITAAYHDRRDIIFVRGSDCIRYNRDTKTARPPQAVIKDLPGVEKEGFSSIDAALWAPHLVAPDGARLDRKLFLFRYGHYLQFDLDKQQPDPGYPKLISEGWPGVTFERIDTVMMTNRETIYFFYGNQYIRFNSLKHCADEGYPQPISKRWAGVTFDRLDVAMYWGNGKAYFFKGDQHIRYDLANYRADPGYPKYIIGNYVEDWKFIDD